MNRHLLVCFIFVLALCACTPCKDKFLSNELEALLFKEGSYWVYSNSATLGFDTVRVVKASYGSTNPNSRPTSCTGDATIETHEMNLFVGNDTFVINTLDGMYLSGRSLNLYGLIFDPELPAGQCSPHDTSLCMLNKVDLTIGPNSFTEVYVVNTTLHNKNNSPVFPIKLYLKDHIGAVKIEIGNPINSTLELQNWHVEQ